MDEIEVKDVLDRRAALAELNSHLRAGVVTLWDAFKTYFTIAGLLFAGCGFLMSTESPFSVSVSSWWTLWISVAGLVITVLAGFGMWRILAYQHAFIEHGLKLERPLNTGVFQTADRIWNKAGARGSDLLTIAVFGFFGAAWLVLALWSNGCRKDPAGCRDASRDCSSCSTGSCCTTQPEAAKARDQIRNVDQ